MWLAFQNARRRVRWPIKCAVLGVTVFAVCFPFPGTFVRHVAHWRKPDRLIEPDAPRLAPMLAALRPQLEGVAPGPEALRVVEAFVYERIPYAWDWDTWGVADYLPTLDEALDAGREDCDGRAVVSASLLRNLGYRASLVTDFSHVWVKTDQGETMSPGPMGKAVEVTEEGLRIDWSRLWNAPRSLAYGIAVFPWWREAIVVAVVALLGWHPRMSRAAWVGATMMLICGLWLLRVAGADAWAPRAAVQWMALALVVGSCSALAWADHRARGLSAQAQRRTTTTACVAE